MSTQPRKQSPAKPSPPRRPSSQPSSNAYAGPEFARDIDLTVKTESNEQDAADHGGSPLTKPERQCVVNTCTGPKVPGAKICSAHEMAYRKDGTPRATGPHQTVGQMTQAVQSITRVNGEKV